MRTSWNSLLKSTFLKDEYNDMEGNEKNTYISSATEILGKYNTASHRN